MKKRTLLFITLAALIATAIVVGIYQYNRKPAGVEDKKGLAVSADALVNAYSGNEQGANAQYLNQVLEVSGTVSEITKNADGKPVLLLQSDDPLSGVQCTMRDANVNVTVGANVTVKGFCNGYTMVVVLNDCILK